MKPDFISLLVAGFSTVLLLIATLALDRHLFTMKADYRARFVLIGLHYGVEAFVIWSLFVLIPFH